MKTKKEVITARLRNYGKNTTKKNLKELQLQLEIRNYGNLQPIRINALNEKLEIMHLAKDQLKKGIVTNITNSHLLNARINKLKTRLNYTLHYLNYFGMPLNKPNIEKFLYSNWPKVYQFYSELDTTDNDSVIQFIESINSNNNTDIIDIENNKIIEQLQSGIIAPKGIKEGIIAFDFENLRQNGRMILFYFEKWFKSMNNTDFPISKFDGERFDQFIRYIIDLPKEKIQSKTKENQYYSIETIKNIVKQTKILFKNFNEKKLQIDDYQSIKDFQLKMAKRNSHIKYQYNKLDNVFSINIDELEAIKKAMTDKKIDIKYRNTAKAFTIQTLLGGLRISELKNISKDSFKLVNDKYYLFLTSNKTKKMIDSPLHAELLPILKSIDFNVNTLFDNSYNNKLKELAEKIGLNRQIVQKISAGNASEQTVKIYPLYELFSNKLARKALVTLLFNSGKYSLEQIATITKHSNEAIQHYLAVMSNDKEKMINDI